MNVKEEISKSSMVTGIDIAVLVLAAAVSCRIVVVCYMCGVVYSFGIFFLAVLCGAYCIVKKALFMQEAFFSVWVRTLLALLFTGTQIMGLYYSIPGMEKWVYAAEPELWTLCLTPLTYGIQNMLFGKILVWARRAGMSGSAVASGEYGDRKAFHVVGQFFAAYAVIFAGFMIPFAAYYPAIMAYDVIPQLDQIKISGYTTHHPLIHTLMLSMSLKIGNILPWTANADRAGLAVYTVLQMLALAGAFSYVYVFMRKKGVHRYICYIYVLCVAFYPTHGMLAVSITKDTIYAVLVMLFTVLVWDMMSWDVDTHVSGVWMGAYTVVTVFLLLFRNNSIYAWIVYLLAATPVLYRQMKTDRVIFRKICVLHIASFVLYVLISMEMSAAAQAVNTTYAREMLSVPAQQIARVAAYHEEELTEKDRERLYAVWGEGNLPEYVPAIADRSKRDIPNDSDALRELAAEWASLGIRYPGEYVKAFLIKNKGMWYLEDSTYLNDIYSYAKGYLQITYPSDQQEYMEALMPGYERHQRLQFLQAVYRYFAGGDAVWRYVPPLALVMQPAFYCWMLIYYCVCCIGLRKGKWLVPAVYILALTGTLLLGPCVLVRYMYPVMLSVTVLILLATAAVWPDYAIQTSADNILQEDR